jgi:eukaryotic-like serine/threonine-protein kinase
MSPSDAHRIELAPGALFAGRYQVEALLGRGGMGAVYRVRDLCVAAAVALKVLEFGPEPAPLAVLRFREEVRLAWRVTHPNVARVYDLGEHEGLFYLTMELVEGQTLRSILRAEGSLSPERAVSIALALCAGLEAAHSAGVIHRDLKPANVLVTPQGRVVITDFGIAHNMIDRAELTIGAVGTPQYMAPEQAAGEAVDARTDLYALGLVVYEMLFGKRPPGQLSRVVATLATGAPRSLSDVVLSCLAPLPDHRPESAREVARMLSDALSDPGCTMPVERTGGLAAPDAETRALTPSARKTERPTPSTNATTRPRHAPVIAVLPFSYRGPTAQDYFGDALTDELVDAFSRVRGISVVGRSVTAKYKDARDPRAVGADVGAYAIVDGTVQMMGERVRIGTRLLEVTSGAQIWSERHEGAASDLFTLQESIAGRVAERLRVEISARARLGDAPPETLELYLAARQKLQGAGHLASYASAVDAATGLERCLALAPDFTPALAAHALASLRCWFLNPDTSPSRDWPAVASASVARALAEAGDLAETHLAAGVYATQRCDFAAAAVALTHAIHLAPTCAEALEYLGMLQCEAGHAEEGVRSLSLAYQLNPTLPFCLPFIARHHAFHGRFAECQAVLWEIEQRYGPAHLHLVALRLRLTAWQGDREALRRWSSLDSKGEVSLSALLRLYARGILGEVGSAAIEGALTAGMGAARSRRGHTTIAQLATEIYAGRGDLEAAEAYLERAVDAALVDLEWMDRCPILAPLRDRTAFQRARARVRERAEAIWTGG